MDFSKTLGDLVCIATVVDWCTNSPVTGLRSDVPSTCSSDTEDTDRRSREKAP